MKDSLRLPKKSAIKISKKSIFDIVDEHVN